MTTSIDDTAAWRALQLTPTEDLRAIKRAYARLLKALPANADTPAFQRLQEAYAHALFLARQPAGSTAVVAPASADSTVGVQDSMPAPAPPEASPADLSPDRQSARDFATSALAALAALPAEERADWLWQQQELVALEGREQHEAALLYRVIEDVNQWLDCVPALHSFFDWSEPAQVRSGRDSWLAELHRRMHLLKAERIAPQILQWLVDHRETRAQLSYLGELPPLTNPALRTALDFILLREYVQTPARHAAAAWALAICFRWEPPDADGGSEHAELLSAFFNPNGQPWQCCLRAAASALIDDLEAQADLVAKRKLLAADPRLEHPGWRPCMEAQLLAFQSLIGAESRKALRAHFGWKPAPSAPQPKRPFFGAEWPLALFWFAVIAAAQLLR